MCFCSSTRDGNVASFKVGSLHQLLFAVAICVVNICVLLALVACRSERRSLFSAVHYCFPIAPLSATVKFVFFLYGDLASMCVLQANFALLVCLDKAEREGIFEMDKQTLIQVTILESTYYDIIQQWVCPRPQQFLSALDFTDRPSAHLSL